ncbi:hypothetical protein CLV59_103560 [Chitinophaga dinghuensis]|uniref:Uncharacterized protein n=1 Tax=Chitinophaga dinghuensis TaxID=1539050 RepID=A0A327W2T2_9BACT|nr:hypothetical protein [Chitinophaga dinghuensis]RAJ83591.1 hypothetical protein CLV59_103560 [Chitinophaga dinghuensis]
MKRFLFLMLLIVTQLAIYMRHAIHLQHSTTQEKSTKEFYNNTTEMPVSTTDTGASSFTRSDQYIAYPALSY